MAVEHSSEDLRRRLRRMRPLWISTWIPRTLTVFPVPEISLDQSDLDTESSVKSPEEESDPVLPDRMSHNGTYFIDLPPAMGQTCSHNVPRNWPWPLSHVITAPLKDPVPRVLLQSPMPNGSSWKSWPKSLLVERQKVGPKSAPHQAPHASLGSVPIGHPFS
ncbi:hypothetical protein GN956_G3498 [Arapaima gigas]